MTLTAVLRTVASVQFMCEIGLLVVSSKIGRANRIDVYLQMGFSIPGAGAASGVAFVAA